MTNASISARFPRGSALLTLTAVVAVAGWETAAGLWRSAHAPRTRDLQALAAAVRAELKADDLITTAPAWIDPVVRSELGDRMPIPMLGRPDALRYPRIFEISLHGARSEDAQGLAADSVRTFGAYTLRLYHQPAITATFDAVAQFADATVLQYRHDPSRPLADPRSVSEVNGLLATPCLFQGPSPATCPPARGPAGAFQCPQGRVERRTLEIAYRPRYGLAVTVGAGQVTQVSWDRIPDAAFHNATLHLWLGLHDYHARKNAQGPAQVAIDVDGGQASQTVVLDPKSSEQGLRHVRIALPPSNRPVDPAVDAASAGTPRVHSLRIRVFADHAPHHHVGILAELRR